MPPAIVQKEESRDALIAWRERLAADRDAAKKLVDDHIRECSLCSAVESR
jgi:hypothetical protein